MVGGVILEIARGKQQKQSRSLELRPAPLKTRGKQKARDFARDDRSRQMATSTIYPNSAAIIKSSMAEKLIHEIIPVGVLQCNCSILGDPSTKEAIVVDPGDEVDRILEILRRHDLKLRAMVSTHTHIDHVGGLAQLHAATKAPV